jgi:hypothetical protein
MPAELRWPGRGQQRQQLAFSFCEMSLTAYRRCPSPLAQLVDRDPEIVRLVVVKPRTLGGVCCD